jgi:two-component system OmpR family sensor kinase
MSIRLRLTLLYTAILALTLASLGATLYSTQLRSMRSDGERLLAGQARWFVEHRQHDRGFGEPRLPPLPPGEGDAPNRGFGGRATYMQLLNLAGQVVSRSENLEEAILPLSDAGLQAAQSGESWLEVASVEDGRLLVYSAPVVTEGDVTEVVQVAHSLAEQDQYLGAMRRNLLVGSGLAVVVAFGTGWVLSGAVLRPIHRITQTAQTIGAERDLSRRVEYTGPKDELGQLATTFNAMLSELETAYRQQQQFVADVSHELRTPLTTLRGNLALLHREPPIADADRTEALSDMVEESDRLIRLVNDLLILARVDARQPLRSERVSVAPLVEDVCRQARLLDPDRSIACDMLPDVAVLGDPDALKQVLLILADNALKHTSGPITMGAETVDDSVVVSVRDTGPGIEPDVRQHLFERFHRGQDASAGSGIGLGLAIAKALVEAQGGAITVESQLGQGSVFTVTLPRVFG